MADSQYNGETRVQVLLEYLQVSHLNMRCAINMSCLFDKFKTCTWKQHLFYLLIVCSQKVV